MIYENCKWCHGKGCLACPGEKRKDEEKTIQPIFTADINNPDDIKLLKQTFGREAIEKAFGEGGGGMDEIRENAAIASLIQALRK